MNFDGMGGSHPQAPLSKIVALRWSWKKLVENPMGPAHELKVSPSTLLTYVNLIPDQPYQLATEAPCHEITYHM